MFSLIKNKSGGLKTTRYCPRVSTINDAHQRLMDVILMTPSIAYEKSKFLGPEVSMVMVARLKLEGIDECASPRVERTT